MQYLNTPYNNGTVRPSKIRNGNNIIFKILLRINIYIDILITIGSILEYRSRDNRGINIIKRDLILLLSKINPLLQV